MKKYFKFFALGLAIMLLVVGTALVNINKVIVHAADYSYTEGVDGISYDSDNNLIIDFTVTYGTEGALHNWIIYFFSEGTQANFDYSSDHKYYQSAGMDRNTAEYYFVTDNNLYEGHVRAILSPDAHAYSNKGLHGDPVSVTDYLDYDTGLTLAEVATLDNWYISAGPLWSSTWSSTGLAYNVDVYVGRGDDLPDYSSTIYFRDFDGTQLDAKSYIDKNVNVDIDDVEFTADLNKVWTGWYCDANKQTYNNLADIEELVVSNLMSTTRTVNFYATYKRGNGEYIEFTPVANYTGNFTQDNENDTILLEKTDDDTTFTVTYKITHNDGVNSILLLPEFNTSVFSIVGVTIDETTALGTATFTNGGFDKILLESNTVYSALNNTFMTITFNIDSPKDGDYTFGLKLYPYVHNDVSEAYYYDTENNGEQNEMAIVVVYTNSVVRVLTKKDAKIEIGKNTEDFDGYEFVYNGMTHNIERIEFDADFNTTTTSVVEYKYNGTASTENIVAKWYTGSGEYDYEHNTYVINYTEISAPVYAGDYYVGISAPAHGLYHAVPTVYRRVYISAREIEIEIDNKSSAYGEAIVPLTYTIVGSVVSGDSLGITLSTTATSSSNVGTYTISGNYDSAAIAGKYYVDIYYGTYTITAKAITITALDQSAGYTGSEPVVDQTKYTVEGATINEGVTITKATGVNVGQYTLTPSYSNGNYSVNIVTGTFYITSVGLDSEYIFSFFSGDTITFDANSHDLLIVDNNIPNWISYTPSNNIQTNANTYTIAINVTLTAADAANYTNNVTAFNSTVTGVINKLALTVTAENKSSAYGTTPATLTPTTVGLNNEVNVSFTVEDNGTPITLTSTTPVGTYDIVPSATSTNYTFTFVNGTYTVTIGQATITSVTAQDVYYNRPLNYVVSGVSIPGIANPVEGTDYTITVTLDTTEEHGEVVNGVRPYGTYTVTVTVAGTSAYNGATKSATFHINQIALKTPANVTYTAYNTVTWDEITTDEGDVALVEGTTVIYSRGVNNEYTAAGSGMLTVHFGTSNNNNYTSTTLELKPMIEVTFIDDHSDHAKDDIDPENMPSSFYMFVGENVPVIVLPDTDPTLPGYTFNEWSLYSEEEIEEEIEECEFARIYITTWSIKTLTMTLKFTETSEDLGEDLFTVDVEYKEAIAWIDIPQPTKASTNPGITYVYNNTVKVSGTETTYTGTYNTSSLALQGIVATENTTFIALYDETYNTFTITYYVSVDGGDYDEISEYEDTVVYGTAINYVFLPNIIWFSFDSWYTNTDRTLVAPVTMPAHDLAVYGSYVFDIGTGDINADGSVDANDITLYRQWIVGGYEMTALTTNDEILEAANAELVTPTETRYFIYRVADNNGDNSKDIRDVSITRMSIVGGYTWDKENGYNVTGNEIIRNVHSDILNTLDTAIRAGKKVTLTGDVTEQNAVINITTDKNVYIDLAGHTLTLESFSVVGTRKNTIKIVNGTIVTEEGITISAPYGNVVLTELTGYDENGLVNLAAANHSLHLNGVVEFYEGTDTTVEEPTPAAVNVEKGTHIVVEPEAEVIVEKIVVTEEFVATVEETAVITIQNYSVVTEEIVIEGNVVNENEISTLEELITAVENGGSYVLVADINSESDIIVTKSLTLDLNEYSITFAEWGFEVRNNATLTFKGNGNVTAVEAPLYVQRGGNLVVNGGTFTATANFVIGTNGSEGRGNNTITINGGIFNGSMTADGVSHGYIACGIYVANNDTVVINGGIFNITNGVGIVARSGNTTIGENVIFNVTGNETLGKVGDSNVTVPTGKTIVLDLKAAYPGGVPTINNNTTEDVCVIVDGTYTFADDDASFHAARGVYDNVILTADLNDYLYVNADMNLYLNGHTIDTSATSNVAIYVTDGAKLTINGNGNVISTEGCVLALNGSEFVINGGTYTCYDNFVFGTNGSTGKGNNKITINNGTFNGEIKSSGYVACGIYVANSDTVVVNGGTFNIANGCGILARSGNTTVNNGVEFNVTGNGTLGKVGDSKVTVPTGEALVLDLKAAYPGGVPTINNNSTEDVYVVVDGTYTFANDDNSFHAARGVYDNVILTADLNDYLFVNKDMNLYLNGHTVDASATSYVAIYVTDGAKLTINGNGNVISTEGCVLALNGSELVINGGTYTCYDNFVFGTNGSTGKGNNKITINNGTFNGEIKSSGYVACGIYVANNDTVVVNGGTFNITNGCGILARSGNTTVNAGVTFNVTGNATLGKVGDSNVSVPSGEVLVLDELANYPGGQPSITNNSSYSIYTINND